MLLPDADFQKGIRCSISAWLPKGALGSAPRAVGELRRGEARRPLPCQPQDIGGAQVLDEGAERPTVGDGMMDGENQQMVVGTAPENVHAIERTLHEIERLAESFLHQFFHGFGLRSDAENARNRILRGPLARIIWSG